MPCTSVHVSNLVLNVVKLLAAGITSGRAAQFNYVLAFSSVSSEFPTSFVLMNVRLLLCYSTWAYQLAG